MMFRVLKYQNEQSCEYCREHHPVDVAMFATEKEAKKLVSILKTHRVEAFCVPVNYYDNVADYINSISNFNYDGHDTRDI